jgi:hypothetical protein
VELADLAERLQALLVMVDAEQIDVTRAMRYRIEGAVAALDAALGRPSSLIDNLPDTST